MPVKSSNATGPTCPIMETSETSAASAANYKSHKADIIEMAKQMADDLGNSMIGMIRNFRCLTNAGKPDYTEDEIAEAIYAGRGESADTIRNAIAWFALEETARELNAEL